MMRTLGLYIHIPFCRSKCRYCDFYSLAGARDLQEDYIASLCRQLIGLSAFCSDRTVDSVYIGGGTPSLLAPALIAKVLETVRGRYRLTGDCEITIEANPASFGESAPRVWRSEGINRVSVGVQTYEDATLKRIGRLHSFDQALQSLCMLNDAGFDNFGADLIYGLPGQGRDEIGRAIVSLLAQGVKHISLYGLKIEKNTPFGRMKDLVLPDEEEQCAVYLDAVDLMKEKGVLQYEISNFAYPGFASRHNLRYWRREDYLGFGPSAHSFFNGERFCIDRDLRAYVGIEDFSPASPVYREVHRVTEKEAFEEELMLSLRLTDGFETERLLDASQSREETTRYLEDLFKNGLLTFQNNRFALTPRGMLVSNSVISDLLLQIG